MNTAEAFLFALIAALLAVLIERLVAHFSRRADHENSRLDAAMESMEDQRTTLEALLARESVPERVKLDLLLFAEAALTKSGAHAMFYRVSGGGREISPEVQREVDEFITATVKMRERDPQAYELYRTFIYRVPIMAFLQRSETYKAMGQLSLRLANEREPAAATDAALMSQESRLLPAPA